MCSISVSLGTSYIVVKFQCCILILVGHAIRKFCTAMFQNCVSCHFNPSLGLTINSIYTSGINYKIQVCIGISAVG